MIWRCVLANMITLDGLAHVSIDDIEKLNAVMDADIAQRSRQAEQDHS